MRVQRTDSAASRTFAMAAVCLAVLAARPGAADGQTRWINPGAGDWFMAANWDGGVPTGAIDAYIDNGGTALLPSGGYCCYAYVGYSSQGTVIQTGGDLSVRTVTLGYLPGSSGVYELSGGRVQGGISVGVQGTGFLKMTDGLVEGGIWLTGVQPPDNVRCGVGICEMTGGEVRGGSPTFVGHEGTGFFRQTGGVHRMGLLFIGTDLIGSDTMESVYELGGTGTAIANTAYVHLSGRLTVSGGIFSASEMKQHGTFEIFGGAATIGFNEYLQGSSGFKYGTLVSHIASDGISTIGVYHTAQLHGSWKIVDAGAPVGRWNVLTAREGVSASFSSVTLPGREWRCGTDGSALWVERLAAAPTRPDTLRASDVDTTFTPTGGAYGKGRLVVSGTANILGERYDGALRSYEAGEVSVTVNLLEDLSADGLASALFQNGLIRLLDSAGSEVLRARLLSLELREVPGMPSFFTGSGRCQVTGGTLELDYLWLLDRVTFTLQADLASIDSFSTGFAGTSSITIMPEPATLGLVALGLAGAVLRCRSPRREIRDVP